MMQFLNQPLSSPNIPPNPLFSAPAEVLDAVKASSSSLDTPETSFSECEPPSYGTMIRSRDWPEWYAAREALRSLSPLISEKRISRFEHCLKKAWFYRHNISGTVHVFSSACKDRACPVCGQRRSYDLSRKVTEWVQGRKNVRFYTFTLRSSEASLDSQVSALYSAFRKLRKFSDIRRALAAGIWFFQATFNVAEQRWHPHLHVLAVGSFLLQNRLSDLWRLASGDSYIVDVRYVRDFGLVAGYVSRYAARPYRLTNLPVEKHSEVLLAFYSRRLFGTWGKLESRPKIKRDKPSLSDYTCLGSYSYVQKLRGYDWRADIIWMAYHTREPLRALVSTYDWDRAVDWLGTSEITIDPAPS